MHPFPVPEESLLDPAAEADVEGGIELTRRLRAWRDLVEVPVASVLSARVEGVEPQEFVARLARFEFGDDIRIGSAPVARDQIWTLPPLRLKGATQSPRSGRSGCSPPQQLDAEAVAGRLEKRREELRAEVDRAERKLGNEAFVAKAPPEVVEEERGKLERYRAELEELA